MQNMHFVHAQQTQMALHFQSLHAQSMFTSCFNASSGMSQPQARQPVYPQYVQAPIYGQNNSAPQHMHLHMHHIPDLGPATVPPFNPHYGHGQHFIPSLRQYVPIVGKPPGTQQYITPQHVQVPQVPRYVQPQQQPVVGPHPSMNTRPNVHRDSTTVTHQNSQANHTHTVRQNVRRMEMDKRNRHTLQMEHTPVHPVNTTFTAPRERETVAEPAMKSTEQPHKSNLRPHSGPPPDVQAICVEGSDDPTVTRDPVSMHANTTVICIEGSDDEPLSTPDEIKHAAVDNDNNEPPCTSYSSNQSNTITDVNKPTAVHFLVIPSVKQKPPDTILQVEQSTRL